MLDYRSENFAEFIFDKLSDPRGKPEVWPGTLVTPKERGKMILRFDMQPISKKPRIFTWAEPDDNEVLHFATEDEILEFYYEDWKEKMKRVGKEHEISPENCIEDFCVIHYAYQVKPKPEMSD